MCLTFRCVAVNGEATTVVAVGAPAVICVVFVRPGVTVEPDTSTHDACTSIPVTGTFVTTWIRSVVDVSSSTYAPGAVSVNVVIENA